MEIETQIYLNLKEKGLPFPKYGIYSDKLNDTKVCQDERQSCLPAHHEGIWRNGRATMLILTTALHGRQRSASHPGRLTPKTRSSYIH